MITRSKKYPANSPNPMAAMIASASAAAFNRIEGAPSQPDSAASTDAATNAPKDTKAECPKFSTSISPNTSERPEAMRKIIIPIDRPATVRVNHDDGAPISRNATAASARGNSITPPSFSVIFVRFSIFLPYADRPKRRLCRSVSAAKPDMVP